jgi:hypothetical protein
LSAPTLAERVAQKPHGWIGVDFDCTIAYHIIGDLRREVLGPPVVVMVERVRRWLKLGYKVRLFTARAANPRPGELKALEDWCLTYLGQIIPITCIKDDDMICIYDDRAVGVEINTGQLIGVEE